MTIKKTFQLDGKRDYADRWKTYLSVAAERFEIVAFLEVFHGLSQVLIQTTFRLQIASCD